jgi:anaerobic ribonucleoside-triphosphate reductase
MMTDSNTIRKTIEDLKLKLQNKESLGTPCEIYSRVTGYYRPISLYCEGKLSEFMDRLEYQI